MVLRWGCQRMVCCPVGGQPGRPPHTASNSPRGRRAVDVIQRSRHGRARKRGRLGDKVAEPPHPGPVRDHRVEGLAGVPRADQRPPQLGECPGVVAGGGEILRLAARVASWEVHGPGPGRARALCRENGVGFASGSMGLTNAERQRCWRERRNAGVPPPRTPPRPRRWAAALAELRPCGPSTRLGATSCANPWPIRGPPGASRASTTSISTPSTSSSQGGSGRSACPSTSNRQWPGRGTREDGRDPALVRVRGSRATTQAITPSGRGGLQDCPGRARVPRRVIAAPGRARRGVVLDGGGRPRGDGTGRNRRFRRRRATVSVSPSVGERRRPATAA